MAPGHQRADVSQGPARRPPHTASDLKTTLQRGHCYRNLHASDLDEALDALTACVCEQQQCSGHLAKRERCCPCGLVPALVHRLEQQRERDFDTITAVVVWDLHKKLPALAAALLKGGHTARAFRRVTEAWEMLVLSPFEDPSPPSLPGIDSDSDHNSDSGTQPSSSHNNTNSSSSGGKTSSSSGGGSSSLDPAALRAARAEVAVALGRSGLLAELEKDLAALNNEWADNHNRLGTWVAEAQTLLRAADTQGTPADTAAAPADTTAAAPAGTTAAADVAAARKQLLGRLQPLLATIDDPLDRSQERYSWAEALVNIWPGGGVLAAPAAGGVVAAAAAVAASHLQCMADMQRVNAVLSGLHARQVAPPRLGGVAAAVELAKCVARELVQYLPRPDQQQQYQQQQEGEGGPQAGAQQQQQQQQQLDLPTHVQAMLRQGYRHLLPLCATAMAFDGLQLAQLLEMKQQREEQLQRRLLRLRQPQAAAAAGAAGDNAAAAAGGGGVSTPQSQPPSGSPHSSSSQSTGAAAAKEAAGSSPASPTTTTSTGSCSSSSPSGSSCASPGQSAAEREAAAAAAALAAEACLLRSAQQLYVHQPPWLAGIPGWGQLLAGCWQDMGYPRELQDEVNWQEGDDDDSSSSTSSVFTAYSSSSSSSGGGGGSSGGGGSLARLQGQGEAAYRFCVDSCCGNWLDCVTLLSGPLQPSFGLDMDACFAYLSLLSDNAYAATHAAQLPVVLLAAANAALQLRSTHRLQLVAAAAGLTASICTHCPYLSWGINTGAGEQQQQRRWQQQVQQWRQQQLQLQQWQPFERGASHGNQRAAGWQVVGLVLQLLQQLLAETTQQRQQQQQQQQQDKGSVAAAAVAPPTEAAAAAGGDAAMRAAVLSCLQLLHQLVDTKLTWGIKRLSDCVRMAYLLQLTEAAVRYLASSPSAAAQPLDQQQQQQQQQHMQPMRLDALQGSLFPLVHNAARALCRAAPLQPGSSSPSYGTVLQSQLLTQAGLSLLLTVTKLSGVAAACEGTSLDVCTSINILLTQLARPDAGMATHVYGDQHAPQRLLEPHPAAMALAGRYLQNLGWGLVTRAAQDPSGACKLLAALLLLPQQLQAGEGAGSSPEQGSSRGDANAAADAGHPLELLLLQVLSLEHLLMPMPSCAGNSSSSSSSSSVGCSSAQSLCLGNRGAGGPTAVHGALLPPQPCELQACRYAHAPGGAPPSSPRCGCLRSIEPSTLAIQALLHISQATLDQLRDELAALEGRLSELSAKMAEVRSGGAPNARLPVQTRLLMKHTQAAMDGLQAEVQQARAKVESYARELISKLQGYGYQLYDLGLLLSSILPTRFGCNSPWCQSVATASEAFLLVRGDAAVCAGCLPAGGGPVPPHCFAARYCSRRCQADHRVLHKAVCSHLRQAAGGGG